MHDAHGYVERATAAPGEVREVSVPAVELCGKPFLAFGQMHPCDREHGHPGRHSFRGE